MMPMQVLSLIFVPSALAVVSGAILRRSLRFKALQVTQLASYLGPYGLIGIPLALASFGVWALVAAMLGQAVLGALLMFAAARHPVRPLWGGGTAGLSRYGWRTAFSNFLSWLAENLPQFLVGRTFGAAPLGLYNAAYNSVRTPVNFLAGGGIEVLYAAGARSEEATEFRRRTLMVSATLDRRDLPADLRRRRGARGDARAHVVWRGLETGGGARRAIRPSHASVGALRHGQRSCSEHRARSSAILRFRPFPSLSFW